MKLRTVSQKINGRFKTELCQFSASERKEIDD